MTTMKAWGLVWVFATGQGLPKPPVPEIRADILAWVGGEPITLEDFDVSLGLSAPEFASSAAWQMDDIRRAILGDLIDRKVLLQ